MSIRLLSELGYSSYFSCRTLTIYFGSQYCGSGFVSTIFIVLDIDYPQIPNNNDNNSFFTSSSNDLIDVMV